MVEYAQSSKQTFAKTVENDNLFKNYTCILLDIQTNIKKQRNWVHEMEIRQECCTGYQKTIRLIG